MREYVKRILRIANFDLIKQNNQIITYYVFPLFRKKYKIKPNVVKKVWTGGALEAPFELTRANFEIAENILNIYILYLLAISVANYSIL